MDEYATVSIADCARLPLEDDSVDLVVCSPPYEGVRGYAELDFDLWGQDWVDWCVPKFKECLRVSRGLVAWVVEGTGMQTEEWSATPALLLADLHRAGIPMWKPSIYGRYSAPGRFRVLRNNWEWIICSSGGKRLPFSDPTAMGGAPVCAPGGRTRPRTRTGRNVAKTDYKQPTRVNAGNILWCGPVGGGNMGSELTHDNEAPYPEYVPEFFIKSFCPPGGIVCDPFSGSGTTLAAAIKCGRRGIGFDIRESQVELSTRRIAEAVEKYAAVGCGVDAHQHKGAMT